MLGFNVNESNCNSENNLIFELMNRTHAVTRADQVTLACGPSVGKVDMRVGRKATDPGGGGVLPYMGYIGMCRCEG